MEKQEELKKDVDDLIVGYLQYIGHDTKERLAEFVKGVAFAETMNKTNKVLGGGE
jgi:hypothetical protein